MSAKDNSSYIDSVYSYHTFLYPFLWDNQGTVTMDCFEKVLSNAWEPDDMLDRDGKISSLNSHHNADTAQQCWDYQAFQYFNTAARKALFRSNGQVIHNYVFSQSRIHNKAKYKIELDNNKTYELSINNIRLKLFNTGVAIIVFEMEYIPNCSIKEARENVKMINEYGRRLYPEFLFRKDAGLDLLCANQIQILVNDIPIAVDPFRQRANAHLTDASSANDGYLHNPIQLPNIIRKLLTYTEDYTQSKYDVTCDRAKTNSQNFYIEPAIDDRMFVCCCILDEQYANNFIHIPLPVSSTSPEDATDENNRSLQRQGIPKEQTHNWRFLSDWETARELYAVTNIDRTAGKASCQNRIMLDQYFSEQLYLRWIEFGTIHAVTNHSMICLTNPEVMDSVVNPFLILYVQMCILTLAQRASLISFDDKITSVIADAQGRKKTIEGENLKKLISLEEDFAIFQGQLLLPELTPQIQGIELYERLQKMLFINKLENNIQQQIQNLYEISEATQERKQNRVAYAFTLLAVLSIFSALIDFRDYLAIIGLKDCWSFGLATVIILGISGVILVHFLRARDNTSTNHTNKRN